MRQYSLDIATEDKLRAEIAALKRELASVKQEKANLEILL